MIVLNPFQANVPFLYPLKTLENPSFFDVFRGKEVEHGLKKIIKYEIEMTLNKICSFLFK